MTKLETKRVASLAAAILDNLEKLGLDPMQKQEVLLIAQQLAIIENARAMRAAQIDHQMKATQAITDEHFETPPRVGVN